MSIALRIRPRTKGVSRVIRTKAVDKFMSGGVIVDIDELVFDLRLAVNYAANAGLLRDRNVLDVLKAAEEAIRSAAQTPPDVYTLTIALSDVARTIAPMTVADLKYGRDPFSPGNQQRSNTWQLCLSLFALIMLGLVGYFMHSLQIEQSAIQALNQIQEMQPQLKLTALRKMAQYDKPIQRESPLYQQFHQRVLELRQVNSKVFATYSDALEAASLPLFPLERYFARTATAMPAATPVSPPPTPPGATGAVMASPRGTRIAESKGSDLSSSVAEAALLAPPSAIGVASNASDRAEASASTEFCVEDTNGQIRLPAESGSVPEWMKEVLKDALQDFCFQLKVLSPGGDGALLNQVMGQLDFVSQIRHKVELRVGWFLPFMFGLLGASVYMMRNVANVRTPAMELFPMMMRLSLGGVAGIVIGWFSAATSGAEITRTVSLPFALSFLVGYGIDALFSLLDRLNRSMSDPVKAA